MDCVQQAAEAVHAGAGAAAVRAERGVGGVGAAEARARDAAVLLRAAQEREAPHEAAHRAVERPRGRGRQGPRLPLPHPAH